MNSEHHFARVDWALLFVRVVAGIIFAAHGAQKLFGAFGGPGLEPTVQMMGKVGYLVTVAEFFGGLGLIVGFLSRFSAASLIVVMLGAIALVHAQNGFFLGERPGFEYNLALIGLLAPILIAGPGRFAVANLLPRTHRGQPVPPSLAHVFLAQVRHEPPQEPVSSSCGGFDYRYSRRLPHKE